jgi:hypothetical protein
LGPGLRLPFVSGVAICCVALAGACASSVRPPYLPPSLSHNSLAHKTRGARAFLWPSEKEKRSEKKEKKDEKIEKKKKKKKRSEKKFPARDSSNPWQQAEP